MSKTLQPAALPYPSDARPLVEVAKRLGIHPITLRRWIKDKHVPAWKVGPTAWGRKRRVFVSLSAVLARATEPV